MALDGVAACASTRGGVTEESFATAEADVTLYIGTVKWPTSTIDGAVLLAARGVLLGLKVFAPQVVQSRGFAG